MVNSDLLNQDELNPPDWLNREFFKNVLKKVQTESAEITAFELKPGTLKNDHYGSVLFRAKVKYILKSQPTLEKVISFILKIEPDTNSQKKEVLSEMYLFQTEIRMYTEALPLIERVLRQYGDETVLGPKLVDYRKDSPTYVVFEDLAITGYTTIGNRCANLDEVKVALLKLAKLHAVSYKLSQEKSNIFSALDKGSLNSVDLEKFVFIKNAIVLMKEVLSEHDDLQKFASHIESVEHILIAKTIDMFNENRDGKRDGIFVLNHGDFHAKNMMISKVDGKLKDIMLIDYQISVFGSPAIDLHYAFIMMFSPEMRRDHNDELFYYYVMNFQETLRKIEYNKRIPTITEFREELQKHRYWGLYLLLSFLIFNYLFSDENGDIAKIIENPDAHKKQLQDPKMLNELRELLPKFLYNGYFEF